MAFVERSRLVIEVNGDGFAVTGQGYLLRRHDRVPGGGGQKEGPGRDEREILTRDHLTQSKLK